MSARRSSLLAWSLLAISVALIGAAIVLEGLNHRLSGGDAANGYSAVLVVLTFAGVGALVASREPSTPSAASSASSACCRRSTCSATATRATPS
jgi:hypothetical protein